MSNNKSPGSDGFTKEFYITLWDTIGQDLVDVLNTCYLRKELTKSMKDGQITLLYKKNDPKELKKLETSIAYEFGLQNTK